MAMRKIRVVIEPSQEAIKNLEDAFGLMEEVGEEGLPIRANERQIIADLVFTARRLRDMRERLKRAGLKVAVPRAYYVVKCPACNYLGLKKTGHSHGVYCEACPGGCPNRSNHKQSARCEHCTSETVEVSEPI